MDDPLLRAWTTQYTNSPVTSSLPITSGERRLRLLRDDCAEENPQPPKYSPTTAYSPMPHALSRERRGDTCSESPREGGLEYINPSLLLVPREQADPEPSNRAGARSPGQDQSTQHPCTRPNTPNMEEDFSVSGPDIRSLHSGQNAREKQSNPPVDIFEGFLAKMLAFDVVRPQSADGDGNGESPHDVEAKQTKVHHGFAISVGWSSTFFPDYIQEGPGYSRNMVAAETIGHS
ncbi:hypothetical protein BDW75DRAFT_237919 [Aspergillus navahoensis]